MEQSEFRSLIHVVVHCKGADNVFLPGGHVEYGEAAVDALKREFYEECQLELEVWPCGFLGVVEHEYNENDKLEHEVNLCFAAKIANLENVMEIESKEEHLEFTWVAMDDLAKRNLQPGPLQGLIAGLARKGNRQVWFESTIKD